MKSRNVLIWLGSSAVLLTGCATLTQSSTVDIRVESSPTGAECEVVSSGTKVKTPGVVAVAKQCGSITIVCKKDGYEPTTRVVSSQIDKIVAGNFLFGGPIGAGVDAMTGRACTFEQNVTVVLNKK